MRIPVSEVRPLLIQGYGGFSVYQVSGIQIIALVFGLCFMGDCPHVVGEPTSSQWATRYSLYADDKAHRIGDIVTIIISESSKASKSAATQTSKKSGQNGSLNDLFGLGNLPLKMGVDAGSDYSGSGTTTRSGSMEARISASVRQVLPSGNLVLEGSRQVTVNDDVQVITVSGVVRPQDIRSDNTVLSIYMADAQIEYDGQGPTAQRPGILTRILQTPFHWVASILRRIF